MLLRNDDIILFGAKPKKDKIECDIAWFDRNITQAITTVYSESGKAYTIVLPDKVVKRFNSALFTKVFFNYEN